nr:MAG TPA: hypothetical protein [Caudoviricetes sp.]
MFQISPSTQTEQNLGHFIKKLGSFAKPVTTRGEGQHR